jgi:cytochrome c2
MAQSLEVNIKTTSDVPQAMDKAKSATVSFSKQVEDIQKKFSTAFKDIFLGFTAPMVLLQSAISFISGAIEKAKQDAKEGLELIAKGDTIYASSEEKKMAAFFKAKKEREDEMEKVQAGKVEITKQFLKTGPGIAAVEEYLRSMGITPGSRESGAMQLDMAQNPFWQKKALEAFLASPEGKNYMPIFDNKEKQPAPQGFKAPEGFGNVVGVGANPVIEAMGLQLEEAKKQTQLLEEIRNGNGGGVPTDFTKPQPVNAASRSGSI